MAETDEAAIRQRKAQRILTDAYARAEAATTPSERAAPRAMGRVEAELLSNTCDYGLVERVRCGWNDRGALIASAKALHECRYSSPFKMLIPSACSAEMTAMVACRTRRCAGAARWLPWRALSASPG